MPARRGPSRIEHDPDDCPICEAHKRKATNAADYSPPNVNYWGDRCCKAEAELERLRALLRDCIDALGDGWDCVDKAKAALGEEAKG